MSGIKKRDRDLNSSEEAEEIFKRSRKVLRSPEQQKHRQLQAEKANKADKETEVHKEKINTEEMEELRKMNEAMQDILKELRANTSEIRELKEEMKSKEKKWECERKELTERIEKLEQRIEKNEKEKRRNNLVIKGKNLENSNNKEKMAEFMKNKLEVDAEIKKVVTISKKDDWNTILVQMETWEEKLKVLKNKNKLKGSNIFIEHDYTQDERRIQGEIIKIAKAETEKGNETKIFYRKMLINGVPYIWDENEKGLVKDEKKQKN